MKTLNEINETRAAYGLAPLAPMSFTAEEDAALAAWAHEQAHSARNRGDERAAQKWEAEAFKIQPAPEFSGPHLISYEVCRGEGPGALPIRLSLPVLCF